MNIYVSIGNSDDKLTQREWADFIMEVSAKVVSQADRIWGEWFSGPQSPYQNACWCLLFDSPERAGWARQEAITLRKQFRQESIAWATADTEFL